MERLFIHAKATVSVEIPEDVIVKLNEVGMIGVITTIQHLHELEKVATKLIKARVVGQVLGCDARAAEKVSDKLDAFLYIGTGRFHPINVRLRTGKPVFTFDPFSKAFREVTAEDITRAEKKRKAGLTSFLSSDCIGILVTTKEGQERMDDAELLKKKLNENGKKAYILISETLDANLLESFPFIKCFVNSACPRIIEDEFPRPVINIDDALEVIQHAA
jgi:2-(3-amino-3-carboxypropyl)histidine synthase